MKIFLIGYMGSGKSKYGKKIANSLSLPFFDLDSMIEKYFNRSITDIFEKEGEKGFRIKEKEVLLSSKNIDNALISVGGGTPCFYNNMDFINDNGCSVYLKTNAAFLSSRLLSSKKERPLIKGKNKEELEIFVSEHLKEREEFYNKAQITLDAFNFDLDNAVEVIRKGLEAGGLETSGLEMNGLETSG